MIPKLIVTDLDNTLYDWVAYFVPAFYAMVAKAIEITGCDEEQLLDDFREVHRRHHDSEHPFALVETQTMRNRFPGLSASEIAVKLDEAIHAFNSVRKRSLALYPGVREGIWAIKKQGIGLVAHTESKLVAVVDRLSRLGIADAFDAIFCIERPRSFADGEDRKWPRMEGFPLDRVRELTHHQRKPNPEVLLEICATRNSKPSETAYVGDSLTRDMLLAKRTGTLAVWARYGTRHDPDSYRKLVRISHWTTEEVEREQRLRLEVDGYRPDVILDSFDELTTSLARTVGLPSTA